MEDDRARIEDYKNRYGYGEKEAEAMYRLKQARSLINEIHQADSEAQEKARAEAQAKIEAAIEAGDEGAVEGAMKELSGTASFPMIYEEMIKLSKVNPPFDALENLILRRALDRKYPEGWGKPAE